MSKAISLHIGVTAYGAEYPTLDNTISCAKDAASLAAVADDAGFSVHLLNDPVQVKIQDALNVIEKASDELEQGDQFLLSFAGHGTGSSVNGNVCRAWCFSDKRLYQKDLDAALALFEPHVCVTVLSTCCHAGTRFASSALSLPLKVAQYVLEIDLPRLVAYSMKSRSSGQERSTSITSHVIEIAACGLRETVPDGAKPTVNSPFVVEFLQTLKKQYKSFEQFMRLLRVETAGAKLPVPQYLPREPRSVSFEGLGPYKIPKLPFIDLAPAVLLADRAYAKRRKRSRITNVRHSNR